MPSCEKEKDESIIFIGDSLVADWNVRTFFPSRDISNKGVKGAKINDVLSWNIDSDGKVCVILIGTNNLPHEPFLEEFKKSFIQSYENVIEALKAKRVIVISILPRDLKSDPTSQNEEIKKLNMDLKNSLSQFQNVYFLDVFDYFMTGNKVNVAYFNDGLHLNYYGYELLSSLLKDIL